MGWISNLFMSSKTVDKAVDAAVSAGDKIWFTEEEKAENRNKIMAWYVDLLDSMKPFNIAMRFIGVGVFLTWAAHILISTLLYVIAFFYCDAVSCSLSDLAQLFDGQLENHINKNFSMIIMFYFGAVGVNSSISALKGKR